jgi:ring-1,2-phenylacetyl-CoA epoxidase subunit PaaE
MVFSLFKKSSDAKPEASQDTNKSSKTQYYTLPVKEVVKETTDAITIYFDPQGKEISYKAGQFFTLILHIDGKAVRRSYSLCTSPFVDPYPGVTVKRVEGGLVSNYLNDHLKAGDMMELMEPMGVFTTEINADQQRNLVFFAGGSGITPMMALAKSILHKEPKTTVTLVYANRDHDAIIFRSVLDQMEKEFDKQFRVIHILENPPQNWSGYKGRISPGIIGDILGKIRDLGPVTEYFMCGPEGMMNSISTAFRELNLPKEKLRKESFTAGTPAAKSIDAPVESAATAPEVMSVTVIYDGAEHTFDVTPDKTILETALDLDIDLPYSCQSGLCTACRGKCLSGKVEMDEMEGLSEAEIEDGYVLTCVGHPKTNNVVIEIG